MLDTTPGDLPGQALLDAVRALGTEDRRRLLEILFEEFGDLPAKGAPPSPTLHEAQPEYLAVSQKQIPNVVPPPGSAVWISFQTPSRLAHDLQAVAKARQTSIDMILNELLSTSLALLQMDHLPNEDIVSLAVRRELAAASVAAFGDFWENEVDLEWQDFQP